MTLLAPWMLAAAAAVGVPIALHFFFKARYQPLPWAAMSFLREALEQTSRRLKFQEWILLLLRCLVILLLALAFARLARPSAGTAGRGGAVDAVFVFDTSYSMGATDDDGKTRLELAKSAALAVLDTLPPNSSVQLLACADRTFPLGPVNRFNLDQARQLIPAVELTGLSGDLLPGLTDALAAANTGTSPAKEVYMFSDLQKGGFERQGGAVRAKCEEIKAAGNLVFVRCGNPDRQVGNVAVEDVIPIGDIPHTKSRVPFVVTLRNTTGVAVRGVRVRLAVNGQPSQADAMQVDDVPAGQAVPVTLTASLTDAGPQVLSVQLAGDGLPGDNVLRKTLLVRDQIRVLVIDGGLPADARRAAPTAGDAGFYVWNALAPVAADQAKGYFIRPKLVSAREAALEGLPDYDVCVLANVRGTALPDVLVGRLAEFVKGGGGLVMGCGDRVTADDYNRLFGSAAGANHLLPFDLGPTDATGDSYPFAVAPESAAVPSFVAPFKNLPFSAFLRGVGVTRITRLQEDGPGSAGGRVLVRTTDQKPFLASRVVGDGEVVLCASSLDETWGNFPAKTEAFLPFVRFALVHLTGRRVAGGTRVCGEPLVWFPPVADGVFELVKPPTFDPANPAVNPDTATGLRVKLGPAVAVGKGDRPSVTAADTAQPGVYHLVAEGKPAGSGPLFTVNPDLRESANLDVATDADLEKWLGFKPAVVRAGTDTASAVQDVRTRREFTEWLLLALLLLLLAESAWAWSCGKAW